MADIFDLSLIKYKESELKQTRHFGDWRDIRACLENFVKDFSTLPDTPRQFLWDFSNKVIHNYEPYYFMCNGCDKYLKDKSGRHSILNGYRCADCDAIYCQEHIKSHFNGHC